VKITAIGAFYMSDKVEQKDSNILTAVGFFWLCPLSFVGNSSLVLQTGEEPCLGFFRRSFDHSVPRIFLFWKVFFRSL